jgi:ABC-2 type transport system permease protein
MRSFWAMMRKEFIHIQRDTQLIGFVSALPVLLLLLFGYGLRLKVDNVVVALWNQNPGLFSETVKDELETKGRLRLVNVDSEQEIRERLRRGTARLGLVIPKDFSEHVFDDEQTTFPLFADGSMPTLAQAGLYGARVLTSEELSDKIRVEGAPCVAKPPIRIDTNILFNPDMRDSDFFLPGTIGIVLMIVTLVLSTGLVREKEQQTIEQLKATPISRLALIAGKMIPYGIIAALDFGIAALLGRLIFDLPFRGSFVSLCVLAALFILSLLALGALISTLSDTQLQASFLVVFVIVPSVLMSGFVFPIEAMPRWLQPVAWSLPMTYFVDAIRALLLKATAITDLRRDYVALSAFVVGFTVLSLARFSKRLA